MRKAFSLPTETIWRDLAAITEMLERLYAALHQCEKPEHRSRLENELQEVILRRAVLMERLGANTGEAA